MKCKEIRKHVPGYFLTKNTWRNQNHDIVYVTGEEQCSSYGSGWGTGATHTKFVVTSVKLSADGSCVQTDDSGWVDKLMPGQISDPISEHKVYTNLLAAHQVEETKNYRNDMFDQHADAFITALTSAGFPGAQEQYRGVMVPVHAVVAWAEAQGFTLETATTDEEV